MGGQDGIRGYLYQTLVGLLDALNSNNSWTGFTFEPNIDEAKVDILWSFADSKKAVQVKSSRNQISMPKAKSWAGELKNSVEADKYELVLIGPHSQTLDKATSFEGVGIPPAKQLSVVDMVQQAAHNLDHYLDSRNVSRTPPQVRELIVGGLVSRLTEWSTDGTPISREDFDYQLREWILAVYPESVREASQMGCVVLANNVVFLPQEGRLLLGLPSEFVNTGRSCVVIDSVVLIVTNKTKRIPYRAAFVTDHKLLSDEKMTGQEPFSGFFVPVDSSFKTTVTFHCIDPDNDGIWLSPCEYTIQLFVKYRDRELWSNVHALQLDLDSEFVGHIKSGRAMFMQVHPDASCITMR